MIENLSVPAHTYVSAPEALRGLPLGRLADEEHDTARASLVGRLIDADAAATQVPLSAFSSSI